MKNLRYFGGCGWTVVARYVGIEIENPDDFEWIKHDDTYKDDQLELVKRCELQVKRSQLSRILRECGKPKANASPEFLKRYTNRIVKEAQAALTAAPA
jgi:hypothetical protein